ncbi:hypothetical protein [Streptomyces sp. NPDC058398]|uniref:hypothetical protein n=1 Tax=Streptomyces sp. NPDC058398 TaxID=3346479 RepID=UPI00364C3275
MTERIPLDDLTSDQLDQLYADLEHYEEHVVGDLNEKNISLARRAGLAEAALDRVRAALASFDGRGVLSIGHVNLDIPTAGEVLDAVRAALDEPPGTYARMVNRPLSDAETAAIQARLDAGTAPTRRVRPRPLVPCPACRRADQAGLAPIEQHDDCAKEQSAPPAAHDAGPGVADCAAADRNWDVERHGE